MPTVADLVVKYSADTADAEAGAQRVQSGMSGMKKAAIGAAIGAGTAVAGFLGASVFAAANFEQAMDGVSASLGGVGTAGGITQEQFKLLGDEALRIGQTTSVGATDAARAMDLLGKAGVSVEEIYGGVAQGVVNVSEATGESIEQSASSFGTLQNMFRDTGISSTQMSDTIVNAMNASDMSLSEMQTGVARLAPVISATGMSFQDSAGAIAYFNSLGFSAAEVGTSLTAAFTSMVAPTTDQAAAMDALGISAFDLQGNFVGFPAIMDQVAEATRGMTEEQKAETIATLFGADARDLMTEATKEGGNPLREYTRLMNQSGTAATASATRMDNLRGDIEQLRGAIETLMIRVGTAMLPGLRNITQAVTEVIEGIMDFGTTVGELMDIGLNPLEAILGAVQIALSDAGWDTAADAVGTLMLASRSLVEAFGDFVDAGQALLELDLGEFFEELSSGASSLFDALSTVSDALFAGLQAAFDAIPWGTLWDTAVAGLRAVIGGAIDLGQLALSAIVGWAGDLLGLFNQGYDWILGKLGIGGPTRPGQQEITLGSFILSAVVGWAGDLLGLFNSGYDWILEKLGIGGPTKVGQNEVSLGTIILDAVFELAAAAQEIASDIGGWIKDTYIQNEPMIDAITIRLAAISFEAGVAIGEAIRSLVQTVTQQVSAIDWLGALQGAMGGSRGIGQAIGELIRSGIAEVAGLLGDVDWSAVAATIISGLPEAILAIATAGPAIAIAIMGIIGAGILGVVEGLAGGEVDFAAIAGAVSKGITDAISNMVGFAAAIKTRLIREFNEAKPTAGDLATMAVATAAALMTAIPAAIAAAAGFAAGIKSRIIQEFTEAAPSAGDLAGIAGQIASALWEGIKDAFGDLFDIGELMGGGGGETGTPVRQTLKADTGRSTLADFIQQRKDMFGAGSIDFSAIINAANAARQAVVAAFTNMQIQVAAAIRNTVTSAGGAFAGLSAVLVNPANTARQAVHAVFVNLQIQLATTATAIVTSVAAAFTPITARLQQITTATVTAVQATFATLPPIAAQIGAQTTQAFIAAFTPIQPQATAIANSTRAAVTSALQAIVGPAGSSGSAAGNAFVSGFRAINAAAGVASSAVGSIRGILASASSGAFGYGAAVGNQFAAGIRSSLGAVAAAAAALRALMPSSPAKTGPLSKPISFDYVNDALLDAMGALPRTARRGMQATSREMRLNSEIGMAARGRGGGQVVNHNYYVMPREMVKIMEGSEKGRVAHAQMSPRGRELALGLRGA